MHKSSFIAIRIVWVFATAILSFYTERTKADTNLTGSSAFIIHRVNPDNWVQECATVFQESCCRSLGDMYVNYSSYDILTEPSGLCKSLPMFRSSYKEDAQLANWIHTKRTGLIFTT